MTTAFDVTIDLKNHAGDARLRQSHSGMDLKTRSKNMELARSSAAGHCLLERR